MKKLFVILSITALVSCAPVRVNYDYDRATDFNTYHTYNYYENMEMGMSELDAKRLLNVLDAALAQKGLQLSDRPDFLIHITSNVFEEARQNNVGVGLGGGGGHVGGGLSIGIPVGQNKMNREIVFEFVDESKSGLFWQAASMSDYKVKDSPEEKEAQFKAIVDKVLIGYPPKE